MGVDAEHRHMVAGAAGPSGAAGPAPFGEAEGEPVHEVTIRSAEGAEAKVITWGAVVRDLVVPRPGGGRQRVVLGFDRLDDYLAHSPHCGAIAGRYANRIAGGRFALDGRVHRLALNERGRTTLHGGPRGFSRRPWRLAHHDAGGVALTLFSPDGDQGFPGDLTATCVYRLVEPATLRVVLTATTSAPTIVNLAQHSYFNLDGAPTILDHELQIAADFYTPVDDDLIPTGEVRSVAGTPFDFRAARPVRAPAASGLAGYDHNFVLAERPAADRTGDAPPLRHAATLLSRASGLGLEVHTTEPGLQVYDGAGLDLAVPGLDGARYGPHAGICLETQAFPDGPNRGHFPDRALRPGGVYRHVVDYRFAPLAPPEG